MFISLEFNCRLRLFAIGRCRPNRMMCVRYTRRSPWALERDKCGATFKMIERQTTNTETLPDFNPILVFNAFPSFYLLDDGSSCLDTKNVVIAVRDNNKMLHENNHFSSHQSRLNVAFALPETVWALRCPLPPFAFQRNRIPSTNSKSSIISIRLTSTPTGLTATDDGNKSKPFNESIIIIVITSSALNGKTRSSRR